MSLNRQFFNDFRPLYSTDDPFGAAFDPYSLVPRHRSGGDRGYSDAVQPFGGTSASEFSSSGGGMRSPNVHLSDEGDRYFVEAEVPGIRKENLDVSIGDNGRSLTIRGGAAVSGSAGGDTLETEGEATSPSVGRSARGPTSTTEYTETEGAKANPSNAGLRGLPLLERYGSLVPLILKGSRRPWIMES
ncbi:hypothetical protein FRC01_010536 [Tulasnella sp. 417]|nr:hypothetical protein FRC01_010536 [Tulasnella sp. 417]